LLYRSPCRTLSMLLARRCVYLPVLIQLPYTGVCLISNLFTLQVLKTACASFMRHNKLKCQREVLNHVDIQQRTSRYHGLSFGLFDPENVVSLLSIKALFVSILSSSQLYDTAANGFCESNRRISSRIKHLTTTKCFRSSNNKL
jgi:hypothetical protein